MKRDPSSLGMRLAKLRFERGLSQVDAVAAMNAAGFYMTRQILGNLETGRGRVLVDSVAACLAIYRVQANDVFPPEIYSRRPRIVGLTKEVPTRRRRRKPKPRPSSRAHRKR